METKITAEEFPALWESVLIRPSDRYEIPPEVIRVGGSTIATLGNFSASTGKGKSKKTFNVCAIVASAITGKKVLGYEANFPEGKRRILYFDTEQSDHHCQLVLWRINRLAGFPDDRNCDLLEFAKLRDRSTMFRRQLIETALERKPDVGLVIIDGLRDLMYDINSSSESAEVIGLLMKWTSRYNVHIHTVLHLNKGDDNVRGHIGTELNHKAETVLRISRNEDDGSISEVHAAMMRDREFAPFAFIINKDGVPELLEGFKFKSDNSPKPFDYQKMSESKHREALEVAFEGLEGQELNYNFLLDRLKVGYAQIGFDRQRSTLAVFLKFLMKHDIIRKKGEGYVYNDQFEYVPPQTYESM